MKYNCEQEFDLVEIYRKLTSPSIAPMVKASEFFTPIITLEEFTQRMDALQSRKKMGAVR